MVVSSGCFQIFYVKKRSRHILSQTPSFFQQKQALSQKATNEPRLDRFNLLNSPQVGSSPVVLFHHIPPGSVPPYIFHRIHPNLYTQQRQATKIHIDLQDKISLLLDLSSVVKLDIQKIDWKLLIVVVSFFFVTSTPIFVW